MDLSAWTDAECVEAIMNMRRERISRAIPRVRFVARLKRAGYELSAAEYAAVEDSPAHPTSIVHVRKGLTQCAERAFDPLPDVYQGAPVRLMTECLADARKEQGLSFDQVADAITAMGHPITRDQYRAIEQGMTRKVPIEVILYAAIHMQVPGRSLFPQLDWEG
jgi:hypothetical protein